HERFEPGLREEAVADPDRVDDTRGVGLLGHREQLVDARRAEQHAPVGEAEPVSRRPRHTQAGRGLPFVSGAANGVTMSPRRSLSPMIDAAVLTPVRLTPTHPARTGPR